MLLKRDDGLTPIQETVNRIPLKATGSLSVNLSSTDTLTVSVPTGEMWFVKSWTITKGADITVDSVTIDGNNTFLVTSLADTVAEYGALITADSTIKVAATNASVTTAQNVDITIKGYKIDEGN